MVTQSELGGAQKYIADLATHLPKDKYQIMVAAGGPTEEKWLKKLTQNNILIRHLKYTVREINFWRDFLSIFEIYFLIKKFKPDIVHLNSSKVGFGGTIAAWFYKKNTGRQLKVIYTAHGFVFNEPLTIPRKFFYLQLERMSGRLKDKIICVSEKDKIVGLNNKVAHHQKFITIHNGIELKELTFFEKKEAQEQLAEINNLLKPNTFWVGTIANFYATKGLIYLIRAAKILIEKYSEMYFIIIGEGGLREELKKEIIKLNLQNKIILLGAREKASQYIKAFDVFCLPSVKEGLPYVILEALAAQVPIVTTNVGGIVEIIENEKNGLVVPPAKPKELAMAIERLILEPTLKNIFTHNNQEEIKKFSLEEMIKKTEEVYEE